MVWYPVCSQYGDVVPNTSIRHQPILYEGACSPRYNYGGYISVYCSFCTSSANWADYRYACSTVGYAYAQSYFRLGIIPGGNVYRSVENSFEDLPNGNKIVADLSRGGKN